MMNRIDNLFLTKREKIVSVYFTAGYPELESVVKIILSLQKNGTDMIEIGMPYSDPMADGPVIQETSKVALANGMTIVTLFQQLKHIREKTSIPLLLMGYINPIIQFGFARFCSTAADAGIDGLIIPDLPLREYERDYRKIVTACNLKNILLITPDTSDSRIKQVDEISSGFIYMVSSAATTGKTKAFTENQIDYFKRISSLKLKNPALAGFGIYNRETMEQLFNYVNGVIIGSAYMRALQPGKSIEDSSLEFFRSLI